MKFSSVLLLAGLAVFNIQCSQSGSGGGKPSKTYYVNGDPKSFIAGTTMKSDLNLKSAQELNGYYFSEQTDFLEVSPTASYEEVLEEQKGSASGDEPEISSDFNSSNKYSLVKNEKEYVYSSPDQKVVIRLKEQSGVLKVVSVKDKLGERAVHPSLQHISIAADKSMFTILVYDNKSARKSLSVYGFEKQYNMTFEMAKGNYDFIAGKNIKIRWKKEEVTLNICSTSLHSIAQGIHASLRKWTDHISSVSFKLGVLNNPPPFSDLNTQCIYVSENYIFDDPQGGGLTGAFTSLSGTTKFTDGDIFILEDSYRRVGLSVVSAHGVDEILKTVTHEMGHFLGLGHPENLLDPEHDTLMSYKHYEEDELFDHDIESIRALYE